ncbi:organic cation transporter 1 [Ixodes scapularis]|uniref:organic cation transporter 1 n=1 Tax=Ixodes scapularis TaxID=6945 RepID=UPI001C3903BA|nr:organic cation transporter 1 [Ixodes scapularis]
MTDEQDKLHAERASPTNGTAMEFEDVLEEVGGYGKFQKYLMWLFLFPSTALFSFFSMNLIFLLSTPDHTCVIPELESLALNGSQAEMLRGLVVSRDECSVLSPWMLNKSRLDLLPGGLLNVSGLLNHGLERQPCEKFVYDKTDFDETVPTQFDLVCSHGHLPSMLYSLCTVGSVLGTLLFGFMADRLGRRITFLTLAIVALITSCGATLSGNFIFFAVLRVLTATLDPQLEQIPYIIMLELVGPDQRTLMMGVSCLSWTFGMCILPLVAYLSRTWFVLSAITAGGTIPFILYWKFLTESPRWLLSQNRLAEASAVLRNIAAKNGVRPPADLDSKLERVQLQISAEQKSEESASVLDLISKPNLRKNLLILSLLWISNSCSYGGLHINVENLSGNQFLNFFYLALVEIPANLAAWWCMNYFGRRWTSVFFHLLSAASCIAPVIAPEVGHIGVGSSMLAKFATTAAFMLTYQLAAELMPTPLRSFSNGVLAALACAVSSVVPYIVYMSMYGKWIPFLFLCIIHVIAGTSASFLPETKGYPLCQTVEDANSFGKGQKYFSFNRREELPAEATKCGKDGEGGENRTIELEPLAKEV